MSTCTFVRKNCEGWEYGTVTQDPNDTKKNKHIVAGKKPTYEEACHAASMATAGLAKCGSALPPTNWW